MPGSIPQFEVPSEGVAILHSGKAISLEELAMDHYVVTWLDGVKENTAHLTRRSLLLHLYSSFEIIYRA